MRPRLSLRLCPGHTHIFDHSLHPRHFNVHRYSWKDAHGARYWPLYPYCWKAWSYIGGLIWEFLSTANSLGRDRQMCRQFFAYMHVHMTANTAMASERASTYKTVPRRLFSRINIMLGIDSNTMLAKMMIIGLQPLPTEHAPARGGTGQDIGDVGTPQHEPMLWVVVADFLSCQVSSLGNSVIRPIPSDRLKPYSAQREQRATPKISRQIFYGDGTRLPTCSGHASVLFLWWHTRQAPSTLSRIRQ